MQLCEQWSWNHSCDLSEVAALIDDGHRFGSTSMAHIQAATTQARLNWAELARLNGVETSLSLSGPAARLQPQLKPERSKLRLRHDAEEFVPELRSSFHPDVPAVAAETRVPKRAVLPEAPKKAALIASLQHAFAQKQDEIDRFVRSFTCVPSGSGSAVWPQS